MFFFPHWFQHYMTIHMHDFRSSVRLVNGMQTMILMCDDSIWHNIHICGFVQFLLPPSHKSHVNDVVDSKYLLTHGSLHQTRNICFVRFFPFKTKSFSEWQSTFFPLNSMIYEGDNVEVEGIEGRQGSFWLIFFPCHVIV